MERSVKTRWFYWFQSIQKVKLCYESIMSVLHVSSESSDTSANEAIGLKCKLNSFQFILAMFQIEKILAITNPLSEQLTTGKKTNQC